MISKLVLAALIAAAFPNELDLRDNYDETYTLLRAFSYVGSAIAGRTIDVPASFTTDFASVVSAASVAFSSFSVASRRSAASGILNSFAQVLSVP